jgi:uncharacterized protein YecE (DUF72 family)
MCVEGEIIVGNINTNCLVNWMNLRIGCSGWSYSDWVGPFYPPKTNPEEYLNLYSSVFDTVEIDATFYRVPSREMVQKWYSSTSKEFIFCPKLPKRITHDLHLENASPYLEHFTKRLEALQDKLGPFVIQLPPSFKFQKHHQQLQRFLEPLDDRHRYAIEFRHESWFNDEIKSFLESKNICQIWSINQYLTTPPTITADFLYLRFVGDHAIDHFNRIQKDQTESMRNWNKNVEQAPDSTKNRFVLFNNHFAGFGPGSVNEFRRLMGLAELDWSHISQDSAQKSMLDY